MRPLRKAVGAGLLLGAALLGLTPSSAEATTLTQAGWWWRVNDPALPATIPAPPTVPTGGLMVAGAPDGATAIAALHFEVDDDQGSPVLTLAVAEDGDQGGDAAVLAACLTGSAWQPESGGAWTNKPFPACTQASVTGIRSDDGASWTFALAPMLSDGILDITLVPGLDPELPEGANGSTFQLVFDTPTAASLVTTPGGGSTPPIDLPDIGLPSSGDPNAGSFEPPAFDGGTVELPPIDSGFTPALPEADQGLTATAPLVQQRNAPIDSFPIAAVPDRRALGAVILALCGAALLWSAQQPTPALRRLGTFDRGERSPTEHAADPAAEPVGVGRFARARSDPAPRL